MERVRVRVRTRGGTWEIEEITVEELAKETLDELLWLFDYPFSREDDLRTLNFILYIKQQIERDSELIEEIKEIRREISEMLRSTKKKEGRRKKGVVKALFKHLLENKRKENETHRSSTMS